jgi:hypothetical protein
VGRVHPSFRPEVARAIGEEGQHVGPPEVLIRRHAYTSILDQGKLRWAARLFERELTDRPNQLRYLIEYGRTLLLLDDPKGHEVLAEALEQVAPAADATEAPEAGVQILLEYVINTPSDRYRGRLNPAQAVTLALKWFPNSPPLLWSLAGSTYRTGNFPTAAEILGRLVHLGETDTYDHAQGFDPRIVGPWAKLNLAQCHRALGTPDLARPLLHSLLEDPEFVEQARSLLAEIDRPPPAGT